MKSAKVLSFVFLFSLLVGCSKGITEQVGRGSGDVDPISSSSQERGLHLYSKATELLSHQLDDFSTYESIGINILNNQYLMIELKRNVELEEEKILVDYKNRFKTVNSKFFLVDVENGTYEEILWETDALIDQVTFADEQIIFSYSGGNVYNGFTIFPYRKVYALKERALKEEKVYRDLNDGVQIGHYTNEMDFTSVEANGLSLTFRFSYNDQTILAGGEIFPRIDTGMKEDTFYLDLFNVVLPDEQLGSLTHQLESLPFIDSVEVKKYTDHFDENHVLLYFSLKDVTKYSCDLPFIEDERRLVLSFK